MLLIDADKSLNDGMLSLGQCSYAKVDLRHVESMLSITNYDIALLNADEPDENYYEPMARIRRLRPNLPLLFVSTSTRKRNVVKLLRAGADGYLRAESRSTELQEAVSTLLRGFKYVS